MWACAARHYTPEVFTRFVSAVHQLPLDQRPIETWFEQHDFLSKAKRLARQHMESCYVELEQALARRGDHADALARLREIGSEISRAYE